MKKILLFVSFTTFVLQMLLSHLSTLSDYRSCSLGSPFHQFTLQPAVFAMYNYKGSATLCVLITLKLRRFVHNNYFPQNDL